MFTFFIIIILLLFFVPGILLIVWVFKRSTRTLSSAEEHSEKQKLLNDVQARQQSLSPITSPEDISNNIELNYKKSFTISSSGIIKSVSGQPVLAYSGVQRGIKVNERIAIAGSNFTFFIEVYKQDMTVSFNGQLIGYVDASKRILNTSKTAIGMFTEREGYYELAMGHRDRIVARIPRSRDVRRGHWVTRRSTSSIMNRQYVRRLNPDLMNPGMRMVQITDSSITDEESAWLVALTVYEIMHSALEA